jgi:stearoyl-CoA desaturase (delta-9 desaturase)
VGYACKWGSFSRNEVVNSVIGNLVTLPLLFPFEAWKSLKNRDNWRPRSRVWWLASISEWWRSNFHLFSAYQTGRKLWLVVSLSCFYLAAILSFSALIYSFGIWGFCKYWFFPWLVYHFWMSTFITMSYHVPKSEDTNATIVFHCKYPIWVEYLTNDMSYMMTSSHYLSTLIPNANIKQSYNTLRRSFDAYFEEISIGSALKTALRQNLSEAKEFMDLVNWPTVIFLAIIHTVSIYGVLTTELQRSTMLFGLFCYFFAGLGITAGYHRYWSHRAYEASRPVQVLLLLMGTSAFEGSVIWWCRDHRAHHRFSDTEKDPYGVDKGLLWAHMGWLFVKQDPKKIGKTDISDLTNDRMLVWQDNNYNWFSVFVGMVVPTLLAGFLFGDFRGGFFYCAILKTVFVLQATWCINSLAHYLGEATYSDQRSPRDSYFVSLITFGEGYHCFHHEFPYDYRNGVNFLSYDPTKWLIFLWSLFGMTFNLKRFPANEIAKGALLMQLKKLEQKKSLLQWGPSPSSLPVFTMHQVKEDVTKGASLIVIDGLVHDASDFIKKHPGGEGFIRTRLGKDATPEFTGTVYAHSLAARNVLELLRVGRIEN